MSLVRTDVVDEGIAVIELDDPARYNALTTGLVGELTASLGAVRNDRSIRAVVLTGTGRGFCAGANMGPREQLPARFEGLGPVGFVQQMQEELATLMLTIRELPQPVIAAIHGAAVGGGLALALASDLRVASEDAFFAVQFIKVGLSSCDVGTSYLLPRMVGATVAAELMLTGRRFAAEEALRIGMLNDVVPRSELMQRALDLAAAIRANSEYGVYMTKIGLWANLDAPSLRHAIQLENRTQVLGTFTGNMAEAIRAFQEKREPVWGPM